MVTSSNKRKFSLLPEEGNEYCSAEVDEASISFSRKAALTSTGVMYPIRLRLSLPFMQVSKAVEYRSELYIRYVLMLRQMKI
jgi:hypothetical protein